MCNDERILERLDNINSRQTLPTICTAVSTGDCLQAVLLEKSGCQQVGGGEKKVEENGSLLREAHRP